MNVRVTKRHLPAFALTLGLAALAHGYASRVVASASAADCEGDACSQVAVTFDDTKQQYRVQNNSADRWVSFSASNLAGSAGACLAPGKSGYVGLKSIVGAYHAAFDADRCGATGTD